MFELLTSIFILSSSHGVDPYLVAAVIQTESKFNTNAVGGIGEIGLMQLRPEYFAGPKGAKELFKPEVNLERGISYLKEVQLACAHKEENTFLVCYNAGIAGGSKLKHPREFDYYKRVNLEFKKFKTAKVFRAVQMKLMAKSWLYNIKSKSYNIIPGHFSVHQMIPGYLHDDAGVPSTEILVYAERRQKYQQLSKTYLKRYLRIFA
jgi:soluble lytic murein transglycosylase-like protein